MRIASETDEGARESRRECDEALLLLLREDRDGRRRRMVPESQRQTRLWRKRASPTHPFAHSLGAQPAPEESTLIHTDCTLLCRTRYEPITYRLRRVDGTRRRRKWTPLPPARARPRLAGRRHLSKLCKLVWIARSACYRKLSTHQAIGSTSWRRYRQRTRARVLGSKRECFDDPSLPTTTIFSQSEQSELRHGTPMEPQACGHRAGHTAGVRIWLASSSCSLAQEH